MPDSAKPPSVQCPRIEWGHEQRPPASLWGDLLEQLQPLRTERKVQLHKSRGVAAGSRQRRDKPAADGISDLGKHNWHTASFTLKGTDTGAADRQDGVRCER